ncbi:MAG TPA: phosphatidate cytidylyltransferase [Gemmataceae bacterium]|nr:phosphatidate cytidylyltransferase [Gemmataceae bacterium]
MLRTRLWMGAVLIALTVGVLVLDDRLAPWYPFLLLLLLTLDLLACHELLTLLGPERRPWPWLCYLAITVLVLVNWPVHLWEWARAVSPDALHWVLGTYAAVILAAFVTGLATYQPPAESVNGLAPDTVVRVALATFLAGYLGVLPSFIAQLRWPASERAGDANTQAVLAMAMAIFIPKCCDTGAYTLGRLIGRHKMSPAISPGKTWEGLAGGLTTAVVAAVILNRLGPVLPGDGVVSDLAAVGFGLTVGGAGVLGDLAESLIKRQYRQKDASHAMPGFGGVLDVVDSIVFAAPVAYCWLCW